MPVLRSSERVCFGPRGDHWPQGLELPSHKEEWHARFKETRVPGGAVPAAGRRRHKRLGQLYRAGGRAVSVLDGQMICSWSKDRILNVRLF